MQHGILYLLLGILNTYLLLILSIPILQYKWTYSLVVDDIIPMLADVKTELKVRNENKLYDIIVLIMLILILPLIYYKLRKGVV